MEHSTSNIPTRAQELATHDPDCIGCQQMKERGWWPTDEVETRLRIIEATRELTNTPEVLQRLYEERLKKSGVDTNLLNLLSVWAEVPWLIEQVRKASLK